MSGGIDASDLALSEWLVLVLGLQTEVVGNHNNIQKVTYQERSSTGCCGHILPRAAEHPK